MSTGSPSKRVSRERPAVVASANGPSRAGKPLYMQVSEALRAEIVAGRFAVGTLLPPEADLVERFGVSRPTVREALRQLRFDGLITSRQGAGSIVVRPGPSAGYTPEVGSIADLRQYVSTGRYTINRSAMIEANAQLAEQLTCSVGESWLQIDGLRHEDGTPLPVCFTRVYVHADFSGVGRLLWRRGAESPVYELIEDLYGVRVDSVEQIFTAYQVSDDVALELRVDKGSTVVEVRRVYRLTSGRIVEVAINQHPVSHFKYTMTFRRNRTTATP